MRKPEMVGLILAALMSVVVAACTSGPVNPNQMGEATYRSSVCGAILGLAGNQSDFAVFLKGNSRDDAVAALHRVRDRTTTAADQLDAAAAGWPPGSEVASRLARTQRDLLPILADLDDVTTSGDLTKWTSATHDYTAWYNSTYSIVQSVVPALTSLGVKCS